MPISNGFTQDSNPNYYINKSSTRELVDENIYYKREAPREKPVEIVTRPIIKETIFLPDRTTQPIQSNREGYTISPEIEQPVYTTPFTTAVDTKDETNRGSFNLIRALGLNADCPFWAWIAMIIGIIILTVLVAVCLYFVIDRERKN